MMPINPTAHPLRQRFVLCHVVTAKRSIWFDCVFESIFVSHRELRGRLLRTGTLTVGAVHQ